MYDRILVPTDGSEYATAAADRAFDLAALTEADVHTICVAESGPLGSIRLPGDDASAEEFFGERAREYVAAVAERGEDRGIPVTTAVEFGIPVREILEYVEAIEADLVVMGTRGRGGLNRMMLGSVTDGVTRFGAVDVLTVSHESESSAPERA